MSTLDFSIQQIFTSVYQTKIGEISSSNVLGAILSRYYAKVDNTSPFYDQPPSVNELTEEEILDPVLSNMSTVRLKSSDSQWRLTASIRSVTSSWNSVTGQNVGNKDLPRQIAACALPLSHYMSETKVKIDHIGCSIKRIYETSDPTSELIRRFCSDPLKANAISRSDAFEIRNLKKYIFTVQTGHKFEVNSWFRCSNVVHKEDGARLGIEVIQDITTLKDKSNNKQLSISQVNAFFENVAAEMNQICTLYFG